MIVKPFFFFLHSEIAALMSGGSSPINQFQIFLPAEVNSFKPVENVHTVLHVHHPDEAGEDTEYGGLRSSEAVNDDGGFVRTGEAGDTVHQVDTVGDGNTEVRPVGTEDDLD